MGTLQAPYWNTIHLRKNESISIDPVRIRGIEGHELVEHNMGNWGHAHRRARVPRVGFEGRIDL